MAITGGLRLLHNVDRGGLARHERDLKCCPVASRVACCLARNKPAEWSQRREGAVLEGCSSGCTAPVQAARGVRRASLLRRGQQAAGDRRAGARRWPGQARSTGAQGGEARSTGAQGHLVAARATGRRWGRADAGARARPPRAAVPPTHPAPAPPAPERRRAACTAPFRPRPSPTSPRGPGRARSAPPSRSSRSPRGSGRSQGRP